MDYQRGDKIIIEGFRGKRATARVWDIGDFGRAYKIYSEEQYQSRLGGQRYDAPYGWHEEHIVGLA